MRNMRKILLMLVGFLQKSNAMPINIDQAATVNWMAEFKAPEGVPSPCVSIAPTVSFFSRGPGKCTAGYLTRDITGAYNISDPVFAIFENLLPREPGIDFT